VNTMAIAKKMVELNRQGRGHEILELYAQDAVSVEAGAPPGTQREAKGLDAIRKKGEWWFANHEVHSFTVTGPWPHDDRFIVGYQIDVTNKPSGQRIKMEEAALYTVRDGKIVREEFFYDMGG
jgi:ketosteroid isomerase-like protein